MRWWVMGVGGLLAAAPWGCSSGEGSSADPSGGRAGADGGGGGGGETAAGGTGGTGGGAGTAGSGGVGGGSQDCDWPEAAPAWIEIREYFAHSFDEDVEDSMVLARVADGSEPVVHAVILEEGQCRYLAYDSPFCDPGCDFGTEICTAEATCAELPQGISAGTLTVTGLGSAIVVEPDPYSPGVYNVFDPPTDLFDSGDPIHASLSGDVFPAASLDAHGVASMDRDIAIDGLLMVDGDDTVVTWTPSSDGGACVELWIRGTNTGHGAPLQDIIECIGPDTGTMTVPRALVEQFPTGQAPEMCAGHDCPPSELSRVVRASQVTAGGRAELVVRSQVQFRYDHVGQ